MSQTMTERLTSPIQLLTRVLLVLIGLAALIFAVNQIWLTLIVVHIPIDEMTYADMARMTAFGGVPFGDIWDIKPPINNYILAAFIRVLGNTLLTVRVAVMAQGLVFVFLTGALAWSMTSSRMATVLSVAVAIVYAAWQSYLEGWEPVMLMVLFTTAAILASVRAKGGMWGNLLAGVLLALAFYSKPVAAPEGFAALAIAAYYAPAGKRWRAALWVVVGGLLGVFFFIGLWWYQGVLQSVWMNAFENSFLYAFEPVPTETSGFWHFDDEFLGFFQLYFMGQTVPFLLPLLVMGLPAIVILASSKEHRPVLALLLLWLFTEILGAMVGRSMRRTYFLQTMPALFAINAVAVPLYLKRGAWVQLGAVLVLAFGMYQSGIIRNPIAQAQSIMDNEWRSSMESPIVQQVMPTVEALTASLDEDECFWAWDSVGLARYLANRNPCTPEHAAHLMMVIESFDYKRIRAEYLNGLFEARPEIHTRYELWSYFPELQRFADRYLGDVIFEGYHEYGTIDIFHVDMSPFHDHYANFDNQFEMIGYDLYTSDTVCAGESVDLSLTWRVTDPPTRYYNLFVQVLSDDQTVQITGLDTQPHDRLPTIEWNQPNMLYLGDRLTLTVPEDTAAGQYLVVSGFYDTETLERLPVYGMEGQRFDGDYTLLFPLTVTECDT